MPPGSDGAVVLWTTGKIDQWTQRPRAIRDNRGQILGREGGAGFEEAD